MTALVFGVALVGLVVWALERNHRRQPPVPSPWPRLNGTGTTDVHDRDAERVAAEAAFTPPTPSPRTPPPAVEERTPAASGAVLGCG
jgi:hypothetical protein